MPPGAVERTGTSTISHTCAEASASIPITPVFQGEIMKKLPLIVASTILAMALFAGCEMLNKLTADTIVGTWQQVSVNGSATVLVTEAEFGQDNSYTGSVASVKVNSGTWTKSSGTYTLTGTFFGFLSTTSTLAPTFTSSGNTMTFTDSSGYVEVYNRK
jgi:hypothetical protein